MSFFDLLTHGNVWPFTLALILFLGITVLEVVLACTTGGDLGLDVSLDLEVPDVSGVWRFFDWLGLGRVPYLISLAAFLLSFGFIGLLAQTLQLELIGHATPWPLVAVACAFAALPPVRALNFGLGKIWPKDVETSAVSLESLVGHEAEVVLGQVRSEEPGQIKIRDPRGTVHYGLAVSDNSGDAFSAGERLLVVGRRGATFTVIRHPNPSPKTSAPTS